MQVQATGPSPTSAAAGLADPIVELSGVTVELDDRTILEDVDLVVGTGELVTVIGPNGAGKTTLVKTVLGLLAPTAGSAWIRPGVRIGYAPQHLPLDRSIPIDVAGFLALGGARPHSEFAAALAEVGLHGIERRQMAALSGGELRRVLLARALLRRPDLLVLDEPLSGVDVTGQLELYELIGDIRRRRGCAVLLVSHDLHLVMATTDRVVCLDRHVCCSGTPETVARDPRFLNLFGDRFGTLVALYHHHHVCRHDAAVRGELGP
ncbi:MAG: metal ABC transporter ATP-binding protein [Geminicoccaceae bacterium]|nr:metal ABC transporter ATP-binding protein [Geminicoccaceae bacterium]